MGEALKTASTRLAYENRWVQSERTRALALVTVSTAGICGPGLTWEFWLEAGAENPDADLPDRHEAPDRQGIDSSWRGDWSQSPKRRGACSRCGEVPRG